MRFVKFTVCQGGKLLGSCLIMEQAVEEAAVSEGTRENHRNTLRHLRDFRPAMTFADLSPRLVADFEGYLNESGQKPEVDDEPPVFAVA